MKIIILVGLLIGHLTFAQENVGKEQLILDNVDKVEFTIIGDSINLNRYKDSNCTITVEQNGKTVVIDTILIQKTSRSATDGELTIGRATIKLDCTSGTYINLNVVVGTGGSLTNLFFSQDKIATFKTLYQPLHYEKSFEVICKEEK